MSLDITLIFEEFRDWKVSGIFIRENGQILEITYEEWYKRFPDREPVKIGEIEGGLVSIFTDQVFETNITHNLGAMANAVNIYDCLWRAPENNVTKASQLIQPLTIGLDKLKSDPKHYRQFNTSNGWGTYEQFVPWVEKLLEACIEYPEAKIRTDR